MTTLADMTRDQADAAGISRDVWLAAVNAKWWKPPGRDDNASLKVTRPLRKSFALPPESIQWPCIHRGAEVGETTCTGCAGGPQPVKVFKCNLHEKCTASKLANDRVTACCKVCDDRIAPASIIQDKDVKHGS